MSDDDLIRRGDALYALHNDTGLGTAHPAYMTIAAMPAAINCLRAAPMPKEADSSLWLANERAIVLHGSDDRGGPHMSIYQRFRIWYCRTFHRDRISWVWYSRTLTAHHTCRKCGFQWSKRGEVPRNW